MAMTVYRMTHTTEAPTVTSIKEDFFSRVTQKLKDLPENYDMDEFQLLSIDLPTCGFFNISDAVLLFDDEIYLSDMGYSLNIAGNIYETHLTSPKLKLNLLNITNVINCLDFEETIYRAPRRQEVKGQDFGMGIVKPIFHEHIIGGAKIFKIPQKMSTIYIASVDSDDEGDFYSMYKNSGLKSFKFEEVWSTKKN